MNATIEKRPGLLSKALTGVIKKPPRVVLFGADGIGKSTWAANAPKPFFLGAEDGTAALDVTRLGVSSWREVLALVRELETERHDFQTFVLDTANWAEPLCWAHVCSQGGVKNIEAFGYGKGYELANDEWRALLLALDRLRDRRDMNVLVLAHAVVRSFRNPEGGDFDRYEIAIHKGGAALLRQWSDAVLFAHYETYANADPKRKGSHKGVSTGARIVATERRAAYDAKNRWDLPEFLPLGWEEFVSAIDRGQAKVSRLRDSIAAEVARLADESLVARVRTAVEKAGDNARELARIENHLRALMAIQEKEKEIG